MKRVQRWIPMAITLVATMAAPLRADELILNGGFENGTYTATVTDNSQTPPTVSSSTVPVGWTPNYAFVMNPGSNAVSTADFFDGSYALSIGNPDGQLFAAVSQTFADLAGATYTGSFWAVDGGAGSDGLAYLGLSVDGVPLVNPNQSDNVWTQFTFTFTGTGLDTLNIGAQTSSSEWYVDDVSVMGPAAPTPEPSSLFLMGSGLLALAAVMRGKTAKRR
jgi:hypothetical protein